MDIYLFPQFQVYPGIDFQPDMEWMGSLDSFIL